MNVLSRKMGVFALLLIAAFLSGCLDVPDGQPSSQTSFKQSSNTKEIRDNNQSDSDEQVTPTQYVEQLASNSFNTAFEEDQPSDEIRPQRNKPVANQPTNNSPESRSPSQQSLNSSASTSAAPQGISSSQSNTQSELNVILKNAVSLPQSLPTGTAMSFSVDYMIRTGDPERSSKFVWILQRTDKQQHAITIPQLQNSDTLQTFVFEWKSREGPFDSYLEEVKANGSRQRISKTVRH